jgi:hypothetical protein
MIVASFASEADLIHAAKRLRAAGVGGIETYTPGEPSEDLRGPRSRIPIAVLVAGLVGAIGMFALQSYATVLDYPLNIGGHPDFSWPAYIPNAFEVGVLLAIVAGFVGFLVANGMPRLYDKIDESEIFRSPASGEFRLAVDDPDAPRSRALLAELKPLAVEELPA